MSQTVVDRVIRLLQESRVSFRRLDHEATFTSEDSARVRNEPLQVGAKALLLKTGSEYLIAVIPANRKLNSAAVKQVLKSKNLRFATADELREITGLLPGALPPFGQPIFDLPLFADVQVGAELDRVAFNAGSRTVSIIVSRSDWLQVAQPTLAELCD